MLARDPAWLKDVVHVCVTAHASAFNICFFKAQLAASSVCAGPGHAAVPSGITEK